MQLTLKQIAWRVAQDISDGSSVKLGAGMPLMVRDYVSAGRRIVFHRTDSSVMVRDGQLDYSVLGADQVSENGDLANGYLPAGHKAPVVGEAMNLTVSAKHVFVMMEYFAKDGSARIVPTCTLPLIGQRCVTTVYTDIAVLELRDNKVWLRELIEGITLHTLQAETDVQLHVSPTLRLLQAPESV
jgi:3-oxoadipate CoA-transferase beta subunit